MLITLLSTKHIFGANLPKVFNNAQGFLLYGSRVVGIQISIVEHSQQFPHSRQLCTVEQVNFEGEILEDRLSQLKFQGWNHTKL